jgi:3-oxoacyl-[acyl-carrier-protein] synthase II
VEGPVPTEKGPKVVVTGMGAVSALGSGAGALYRDLCAGRSGLEDLTRFETSGLRHRVGGEVRGVDPVTRDGVPCWSAAFAECALREALGQAGLDVTGDVALVAATNFGCVELAEAFLAGEGRGGAGMTPHAETLALRGTFGLGGPAVTLSLSCSSGNSAIGCALDLVRGGEVRAAVALAYDALSRYAWAGLAALHTMTTGEVRPFDGSRKGTLFGEGAGAVVLERAEDALRRDAEPLVEVAGHAENNNAYHLTASEATGEALAGAMAEALRDAGVEAAAVTHYNAHGTATKQNDRAEAAALKRVFGDRARRLPVTGLKPAIGHAMGAAGMLETLAAAMTVRDGVIPPTLNCQEPDPELGVDVVVGAARKGEWPVVLSGSAGIGGGNAMVVLRRWRHD